MTAHAPTWQLQDADARLTLGALLAHTDAQAPFSGLTVSLGAARLRLFQLELPLPAAATSYTLSETYVRGQDLVSTYFEEERRRIRAQIYRRAFEWGAARAAAIDLIISVQTSLLDSDPTLKVRSTITAQEVLGLTNLEQGTTTGDTPAGGVVVKHEGKGPACWLFRLNAEDFTYVEMVHPADFVSNSLQEVAPGEIEHATRLFRGPLEKGVILRSRLRGVVLPRAGDVAAAIACYQEFAASEPPLTT